MRSGGRGEDALEEGGFPRAKETGEDGDGEFNRGRLHLIKSKGPCIDYELLLTKEKDKGRVL